MFNWVLILGISLASAQSLETMRFTAWDDLKNISESQIQLQAAVKKLESSNGSCTATTISSQGHMLSARHCLRTCLIRSKVFVEELVQGGATNYFKMAPENLEKSECSVTIDQQDVKIKIEATSPGMILSMNVNSMKTLESKLYKELVEEGYTDKGDYVIFKVKGLTEEQACVPISTRPVKPGDMQESLGYPAQTNRPDGFNSDGEQLYYSKGYVLSSIAENSCVQETTFSEYNSKKLLETFDHPKNFMTTLDAIYGSSGTAVMGPDNGVAGILTNVFRLTEYTKLKSDEPDVLYCKGSGKALSMATILKSLEKQGYNADQLACP